MSYIGVSPAQSFTALLKQDFTTSATTSYTLDHAVNNANDIALFINFVRQEPTAAYSASGTSLTLTSATSGTDDMYCIYLGQALQTVNPSAGSVGLSQLSATGTKDSTTFLRGDNTFNTPPLGGITQADVWRLNTNLSMSNAGLTKITANLERDDTAGFDYIGTGMTQSSGNFSFPSTGIYYIEAKGMIFGNSIGSTSDYNNVAIFTSINSGSSFTQRGNAPVFVSGTSYNNSYNHCFFDVTNTSTHQVAFYQDCHITGVQLIGNTTQNSTSFTFIRLGDT